jgi:hypothetical protein
MYSQYGQDDLVIELLRGKRNGYFLDTGASDGVSSNNTLLLERNFGWRGLCVEPNEAFFSKLRRVRRCDCVNVCLYDQERDLPFLEAAGTLGGVTEDFEAEQLASAMARKRIAPDERGRPPVVIKRSQTLLDTLRRANAPPVIDYWSLDVEGSELRLLRSFPFESYSFNLLTVEHNWQPVREEIRGFLTSRGYEFVAPLEIDDCYLRSAAFPSRHAGSRVWRRP